MLIALKISHTLKGGLLSGFVYYPTPQKITQTLAFVVLDMNTVFCLSWIVSNATFERLGWQISVAEKYYVNKTISMVEYAVNMQSDSISLC